MRPYIFSLIMMLLTWQSAMAQQQQPAECVQTAGCLTFSLNGATRHNDDTYVLSYTLTVNCPSRLEYIAFQLPEGAEASEPSSYFARQNDFIVQDGKRGNSQKTDTNFNAIQFTAKNQTNISNGASYTFQYPVSVANYNALDNIQVQAKVAGADPVLVAFDHRKCAPLPVTPDQRPMPECRIDLGAAVFGFLGATNNNDGTTTVGFIIQNNLPDDVTEVAIEIPNAPENVRAEAGNNGGSYQARYKYKTTYTEGILHFAAQQTKGYANGQTDYFLIQLPTAAFDPDLSFTLLLQTQNDIVATGFNTITCSDAPVTPLPVELLSFKGKATQSGIQLDWETASESNNDRFEVQRSTDGRTFDQIATIAGAGNSSIKQRYSHTDPVSRTGMYYYRLRQVDYDGTATFSKTISVQLKALPGGGQMAVFPNPAAGNSVTVSVAGTGADVNGGSLQIVDMSGRVVYTYPVTAGSREVNVPLPALRLPKGMYVVNLLHEGNRQTQKLIVQ
ncbi:MAG TPA: T9SS type A sorting domain-containing protein [Pontibacter sp.]